MSKDTLLNQTIQLDVDYQDMMLQLALVEDEVQDVAED